MTPDELKKLISNHEDNFVERKAEGVSPQELRQTVSAFANSVPEGRQAVLFIGIDDKTGEVRGVTNTDKLQQRVRDACHGDCYPRITYMSEVISVDDKRVVAVVIPFSAKKPHFTGPAYIRAGSESVKASEDQYEDLIASRTDKARTIQSFGSAAFHVIGVGYKLGTNRPVADSAYREGRECRVMSCNAMLVSLEDISSGFRFSEPLAHITINYDHERTCPVLLVRSRP